LGVLVNRALDYLSTYDNYDFKKHMTEMNDDVFGGHGRIDKQFGELCTTTYHTQVQNFKF